MQYKGASDEISGSNVLVWDATARNLQVNGTTQIGGIGNEVCGTGAYGKMRFVEVSAGAYKMQVCRP